MTAPARQSFGLDFDDTYTADVDLWKAFVDLALSRGHAVWIVTCRRDTPENRETLEAITGLEPWRHVYTGMGAKRAFCEARSLPITIWIDDRPESIWEGR